MINKRDEYYIKLATNFYSFVREAWQYVDSSNFRPAWHIKALCDHFQAIEERKINRLLINIPTGFGKSLISSVFYPAWAWIGKPKLRFLTGSHSETVCIRDARKSRQLIESEWYQEWFGHIFQLSSDQNQKTFFYNNKNGYRITFTTGGAITGQRADRIILDDPIDARHKYSDFKKEEVNTCISQSLMQRLDPIDRTCAFVMIMQRLHNTDPTGYVLNNKIGGNWEHLCLPSEYKESLPKIRTSIFTDPRTQENELLWEDAKQVVEENKINLGRVGYSAQFLQSPVVEGGEIISYKDWQKYEGNAQPVFERIIQSWDTAFKKGAENDYSVCATVGVYQSKYYIIDIFRKKMTFPELKKACIDQYNAYRPHEIIIEDKASGQDLIAELQSNSALPVKPIKVLTNKENRCHAIAPIVEAHQVFLLKDASWNDDLINEFTEFPSGAHDDIVDSVTMALNYLRDVAKIIYPVFDVL